MGLSNSKVMQYACVGVSAALNWTIFHVANEMKDGGYGHLTFGGMSVDEILETRKERHRQQMVVLDSFKKETDSPGLFKVIENGGCKFGIDSATDRPAEITNLKKTSTMNILKP